MYKGLVAFANAPGTFLTEVWLGWKKDKRERAAKKEPPKGPKIDEKALDGYFTKIMIAIIGLQTYSAIEGFVTDPVDYILKNWLGWTSPAAGQDIDEGAPTSAAQAAGVAVAEKGTWSNLFGAILRKILPPGLITFLEDPV